MSERLRSSDLLLIKLVARSFGGGFTTPTCAAFTPGVHSRMLAWTMQLFLEVSGGSSAPRQCERYDGLARE